MFKEEPGRQQQSNRRWWIVVAKGDGVTCEAADGHGLNDGPRWDGSAQGRERGRYGSLLLFVVGEVGR